MRKILQSLETGDINLIEVPTPVTPRNHVLIETRCSLISSGTERMLLEFGKSSLIKKAMQQPDRVKQVIGKARTDGVASTIDAVRSKLKEPIPLGYCNTGIVRAVGDGVSEFKVGDRVVSNGSHSELVVVGKNLVAKVPDGVKDTEACFVPLAAIGLQGCRLANPSLGETFCVIGLGLIGLLTAQLLRSHGCRVIGVDFNTARLDLAKSWGLETINLSLDEDPVETVHAMTGGRGADGVIITASTDSNDPVTHAAQMSRKRGKIILVGVSGLQISRADFYEKELTFQVSCSYGPGRYDTDYEVHGNDYPLAFVRWTEQRNFEAVLEEIDKRRLDVQPLITEIIDFSDATKAYDMIGDKNNNILGVLLSYQEAREGKFIDTVGLNHVDNTKKPCQGTVALIGIGGFGARITAPGLKAAGARLKTVMSQSGVSAVTSGAKVGFEEATTDIGSILSDADIDSVVITTRHDSHAPLTMKCLRAGKNVFVEKPLALLEKEIDEIEEILSQNNIDPPQLMIGFNRRFAPTAVKMKALLNTVQQPKCLIATINAGSLPGNHWAHDSTQGGGRIIGEACHFIDLMRFFIGAPITGLHCTPISALPDDGIKNDKVTITLSFEDGSIGTLHYFANGPKALMKERYEAFVANKYLCLENFQKLESIGWKKRVNMKGKQDKGHAAILRAFISSIQSGNPPPIALEELLEISRWTIRAAESIS